MRGVHARASHPAISSSQPLFPGRTPAGSLCFLIHVLQLLLRQIKVRLDRACALAPRYQPLPSRLVVLLQAGDMVSTTHAIRAASEYGIF